MYERMFFWETCMSSAAAPLHFAMGWLDAEGKISAYLYDFFLAFPSSSHSPPQNNIHVMPRARFDK